MFFLDLGNGCKGVLKFSKIQGVVYFFVHISFCLYIILWL